MTRTACFVVFSTLLFSRSYATIIYDVDFENPPHVVDQQVVTGSGADRPQFADTSVIVRDGPADFTSQAASLEPAGSMVFMPPSPFTSGLALLSWDMAMISLGSSGAETAAVSLDSNFGGSIVMFFLEDLTFEIDGTAAGSFTLGQQDTFSFQVDLDNEVYDFLLNGSPVLNDQTLDPGWDLRGVSFGRDNLADPTYAVDNFQWTVIPEPSSLLLMLVAGLGLWFRRLRFR